MAKAPFRGLDRIGSIIKGHLDAETSANWRLRIATPRSYWVRRFTLVASKPVPYFELESAFNEMDSDSSLDKLMTGRPMTIWSLVYDPVEEKELLLTLAAFGEWQTAMLDMAAKLEEWVTRYNDSDSAYNDESDSAVLRLIVFVGKR